MNFIIILRTRKTGALRAPFARPLGMKRFQSSFLDIKSFWVKAKRQTKSVSLNRPVDGKADREPDRQKDKQSHPIYQKIKVNLKPFT